LTLFNVLLAGVGMYLFARYQEVSPVGALIAGLAFAGSGMLQLGLEMPGVASVYGWLPWMLLAMDKALRSRSSTWSAVAVLVCGLQLVSGHLQWVLYSYLVLGCWVLWRALLLNAGADLRTCATTLVRGAAVVLGGVALAAVHLAPFLELAGLAGRTEGRVSSNSWPLYYLLRLVTPEYFGTAAPGVGVPLIFNDLWYVGIAPLFLAFVAILLRPAKLIWFWVALSLLSIAVTFGIGPFLYARWLPGLSALLPMRIGYILIFSVAMLAGLGLDALIRDRVQRRGRELFDILGAGLLLIMILVAAWFAQLSETELALKALKEGQLLRAMVLIVATLGLLTVARAYVSNHTMGGRWISRKASTLAVTILVGLVIFDLVTLVPNYNSWVKPDQVLPSTPSIEWLRANAGYERVMGVDSPGPVFNPNTQSLFGIHSVAGYDSLHTRRLEEYWGAVDQSIGAVKRGSPYSNVFIRPQVYTSTLAALMNVRYVAASNNFTPTVVLKRAFSSEITVYENTSALPRAFLVEKAQVLPPSEVLERLATPDFDPTSAVLIEEEHPSANMARDEPGPPGNIVITSYRRNSVRLEATLDRPAWLVLSDQNYPGWAATVDGVDEKVYTAYYLFRAVRLGVGRHDVVFSFQPTMLLQASVISAAAIALIGILLGRGLLRGRMNLGRW
ncbi:MAG: YfhO family protein, partial [Chloroflexia bacterium]